MIPKYIDSECDMGSNIYTHSNITLCTGLYKTKTLKQWPKPRTVKFGVVDPESVW